MVALRQVDVDDLNARARAARRVVGELPNVELEAAARSFAVGDRVVALENARRIGVLNGQRGTVTEIDLEERVVRVGLDTGRDVEIPAGYLDAGRLAHAYAITGHKAQGMTADRCYVLGDEAIYREWGYVALSRGREHNSFYIVAAEETKALDLGQVAVHAADPFARVQRAVERSGAKELAHDGDPARPGGHELRERSDDQVRRERDDLATTIGKGPADPTDELDRLRERWTPIEHALIDARRDLDAAQARLTGRGLRRVERGAIEGAAVAAQARVRELETRLAELARSVREVGERHRFWREWAGEAAPQLRRYLAVEAELADRAREAARWAQVLETGEVIDLVGTRPDGYSSRSRWRQALETVSSHILRWGSQPGDVREAPVRDLEVARQHHARQVERALREVTRAHALERGVEHDIGPSL